jgi:hypothetical protein
MKEIAVRAGTVLLGVAAYIMLGIALASTS